MSPVPLQSLPLVAIGVFVLVSLVLVGIAVREVWLVIRYRRSPTPIGELSSASGRVVVSGIARTATERLHSPITDRECLAYAWRVSDVRTLRSLDGQPQLRRENVGVGQDAVPFLIEDWTGSVRVDPEGAELRLAEEWVPDPVADPVDRADVVTGGDQLGGEARSREYFESRLEDGESVTVRGRVGPDDDAPLSVRELGVQITGGGALIEDATPAAASRRALKRAAYAGLTGLFMLLVLGIVIGSTPV